MAAADRIEVVEYGPLQRGDVVKIARESGAVFKFLSAVVEDDAVLWVNLHGGTANHEKLRSVAFDRLKIPSDRQLAKQREERVARAVSK